MPCLHTMVEHKLQHPGTPPANATSPKPSNAKLRAEQDETALPRNRRRPTSSLNFSTQLSNITSSSEL